MSVTFENIGGFGNKLRISNGIVNVDVSTDFGPNILNFSFVGKEGFFFNDEEMKLKNTNPLIEKNYGIKGAYWDNYGGHRLWESPERKVRTVIPANEKVEVEKTPNGAIFKTPAMPFVNTRHETEIVLRENKAEVEIYHRITNRNAWAIELAPWAITVLKHGGIEVMPVPKEPTGLLPNSALVLWPYTKLNDKRYYFGENYIMLKPDSKAEKSTKIGIMQKEERAYYFINNMLFEKQFAFEKEKTYPDFGVNFETYSDRGILECETLAPLTKIDCGETACHSEVWKLYDNVEMPEMGDEEAVEKILSSLK